ncbi:MAG: anhydro-N-acetylmuramic acid kinase [Pseudomonadota bacterium]
MEGKGIEVGTDQPIWAMGLMSGTSMDGVDAAMLLTDGVSLSEFGPSTVVPYGGGEMGWVEMVAEQPKLYRGLDRADPDNNGLLAELLQAEADVETQHVRAVTQLLAVRGCPSPQVLGFHGQTVGHAPDAGWTWQLGSGEELARILNRPVVWDFRTTDVQAGGEGAPLAPFFHFALAKHIGADSPLAFLNIGGVANVTCVDPSKDVPEEEGALLAFDTGPGNALLNDWMQRKIGEPLDRDGETAATGDVDWMGLHSNFGRSYLQRLPPKSLDRNDFHGAMNTIEDLSVADGAATLTALTAECVGEALEHMPSPPSRWLVCGGGRLNPTMMRMLQDRLDAPVEPVEAVGLDGDMLEAQAFAYLAVRVLRGLPTSAPSTTGCREPVCGGRISYPG